VIAIGKASNISYIIGVGSWCSGLGMLQVRLGVRQDPHRSPDRRASAVNKEEPDAQGVGVRLLLRGDRDEGEVARRAGENE
jgi:hypothetical protein